MTGQELIHALRFMLHDTEQLSDTGALFYSDTVLEKTLTDALAQILKEAILESPRRSPIAVSRLSKRIPITTPEAVPDDFWILECGTNTAGANDVYVPAIRTELGDQFSGLTTYGKLYVSAGAFFGPADHAIYFVQPPQIQNSTTKLPLFCDAVYNAAKTLAATNAIIQESKSAPHRWNFYSNDYKMARLIVR